MQQHLQHPQLGAQAAHTTTSTAAALPPTWLMLLQLPPLLLPEPLAVQR
jgi:hypothetical protein